MFDLRKAVLVASLVALAPAAHAFQPAAKPAAAATAETAEAAPEVQGDPVRGKVVYQRVGNCSYCHGWAGDGEHGKHPRSPGVAADLRASELDTISMMEIVRCGIPGTAMPYHVSAAFKDPEICYGLTMDDFEAGNLPVRGKTFRETDVVNVVAYIQTTMQGKELTLADCEEALKPGDKACDFLR